MPDFDDEFLMRLLRACGEPLPLYPGEYARKEGLNRDRLDAGLDELRRRGLVRFTEWVKGAGQGYAVTDAGREALQKNRLLTAAPAAAPPSTATAYDRGDVVRSALFRDVRPYASWTLIGINLAAFALV